MDIEGIDAERIIGVDIEPMGEFVRLVFEKSGGGEFAVRVPAKEFQAVLPDLLTLPGRAEAVADPIGTPTPTPGGPARKVRVLPAAAAVIRTNTDDGKVLFEFHIGKPPYPVFFSFPRDKARMVVEEAARALATTPDSKS